jgi:hypothetical protein
VAAVEQCVAEIRLNRWDLRPRHDHIGARGNELPQKLLSTIVVTRFDEIDETIGHCLVEALVDTRHFRAAAAVAGRQLL